MVTSYFSARPRVPVLVCPESASPFGSFRRTVGARVRFVRFRPLVSRGFFTRDIQAHTGRHTRKRPRSVPEVRMSSHQRKQPAAAADTDEQEQQQQPQCRICLDGPDPDLGRLIRPCLCSGTVSVSTAKHHFFFPTIQTVHAKR